MSLATLDSGYLPHSWTPPPSGLSGFSFTATDPVRGVDPLVSPPTSISKPEWFPQVYKRLGELWSLRANWDSRGSAAPRREAISFALQMLFQTTLPSTRAPSIVPLGNGGLQLLWSTPSAQIEVEVLRPYEIVVYHLDRLTGTDEEWHAGAELSKLAALLRSAAA